jgi:hypothetical protein
VSEWVLDAGVMSFVGVLVVTISPVYTYIHVPFSSERFSLPLMYHGIEQLAGSCDFPEPYERAGQIARSRALVCHARLIEYVSEVGIQVSLGTSLACRIWG